AFPAPAVHHPGVAELALLHAGLCGRRALLQRGRPAALADQAGPADRLLPGGPARHLGNHQASGFPHRRSRREPQSALREADAMIPLEWMPPLMFAGLVVFMIIGYPVAFSLAAVGFFFGFLSIEMGYFT